MDGHDTFKKRRIVVLGSRAVGKSALVLQFLDSRFVGSYHPTIENTYTKIIEYDGAKYECTIVDTAGQDEFSILHEKHAIGVHGYVLVYSITSESSLDMVKIVYDKIIDFCGLTKVPMVLVGQKSDFPHYALMPPSRRVSAARVQAFAAEVGCPCIETSARDNLNVDRVFELCLAEIEKKPKGPVAPPAHNCCLLM